LKLKANGNLLNLKLINIVVSFKSYYTQYVKMSTFINDVLCLFRYRGKLISFNEFQTENTRIELIDIGSVYQTKLDNLFVLPYYFMYEPLVSKSYLNT